MQVPEFPEFRRLVLEDKPLLDSLLKEMQPLISEFTFTNLFVWDNSEPVRLSRLEETVLIERKRIRDARTFLLPPVGRQTLTDVLKALRRADSKEYRVPPLYGITPQQTRFLEGEAVRIEPDRDDWDYVYLTSDLADLPGDRYHPKRNFIARCLSNHKCEYVTIGRKEVDECLQLQTRWCSLRDCNAVQGLEAENTAIKAAFDNYEYLGVSGGAVYVDGKLEAFTLAEPLNDETAVIHFEKANPAIEGLYQVVNQWFCQRALGGFRFVNREQDLGVPGLRKAKQNYYPHHMIEKNIIYLT